MNSSATHLSSHRHRFVIAQISDLHLSIHDPRLFEQFLQVLTQAISHRPDLLLLTGDLVNDGDQALYDQLFEVLTDTQLPFACLAGNHDVTLELNHHLPFDEREFLPICADSRLPNHHAITIALPNHTWQILLINTAQNGRIDGKIHADDLAWLDDNLHAHVSTIIAMHHHPIAVGSAWIDAHQLQNANELWQIINQYPHVQHIICGHVHQAGEHQAPTKHACTLYTCPAVSRQFLPHHDDFALDTLGAGFRLLTLDEMGNLSTQVHRLTATD